jgi:hypothetical protein
VQGFANPPYLSRFLFTGCCALSGVSSGVKRYRLLAALILLITPSTSPVKWSFKPLTRNGVVRVFITACTLAEVIPTGPLVADPDPDLLLHLPHLRVRLEDADGRRRKGRRRFSARGIVEKGGFE